MKTLTLIPLVFIILAAGASAQAASLESSMSGFVLRTCTTDKKKCLEVQSNKTEGSQLKMLHVLKKTEVIISTAQSKISMKADSGYIDIIENQLVLFEKYPDQTIEIAINLNDGFKVTRSVTRF
jgi:hypothetical protein